MKPWSDDNLQIDKKGVAMIHSFAELEDVVRGGRSKRIALAMAEEPDSLKAVLYAKSQGIVQPILVGNRVTIEAIVKEEKLSMADCELVEAEGEVACAQTAVELIRSGKADCLMKGKTSTATFLKAVLDKEKGIRSGSLLSHVVLFEIPEEQRLMLLTDCAIAIKPDLETKIKLIENSVAVAQKLGIEKPKVAIVGALEKINPQIPTTMEAAVLSKMAQRGQIANCIVDGPLSFDNAVSLESCVIKGIDSTVGGVADILLLPDLEAANILYKALTIYSQHLMAGLITGAKVPIILVSRADKDTIKYHSILSAVALS